MKQNLILLAAAGVIALGGFAIAKPKSASCVPGERWHGRGFPGFALERLIKGLDLTADQKVQVQSIIDQTKPQIIAIHEEALQKTHAVIDDAKARIRPLLTAQQQAKLDDLEKAREMIRGAEQKVHDAIGQ